METKPVHTFDTNHCLSETQRIFGANSIHFFTLSYIFHPLSLSLIIDPTLSNYLITINISYFVIFVCVLPLCAISMITYTTYHGFSGKPVELYGPLKSLPFFFCRLVSTAFVALIYLAVISLTFLVFVGAIVMLGQNLGFVIDYSIKFSRFSVIVGAPSIVIILYFLLNWSLAFVVVVAESKWGIEALIRSSYLLKGMRWTSFSLLVFFGVLMGCNMVVCSLAFQFLDIARYVDVCIIAFADWYVHTHMDFANTVLYMYCKTFHGELAIDIANESAHDYVNMPSGDERVRVPHVVSVLAHIDVVY